MYLKINNQKVNVLPPVKPPIATVRANYTYIDTDNKKITLSKFQKLMTETKIHASEREYYIECFKSFR